jgi:hypothetical protein
MHREAQTTHESIGHCARRPSASGLSSGIGGAAAVGAASADGDAPTATEGAAAGAGPSSSSSNGAGDGGASTAPTAGEAPASKPAAFDPLGSGRRKKQQPAPAAAAAAAGGPGAFDPLGRAGRAAGGARAAMRPEAAGLEDDLLKLVAEWSTGAVERLRLTNGGKEARFVEFCGGVGG